MTEKKIKELIFRIVSMMYMVALTIFVSNYILKVFEEDLWDNEKTAMRAFMSVGMLLSLFFFSIKEKSLLKLMFVYHFILIGTAVCAMIPLKFMPCVLIPMVVTAIYNIKYGLMSAVSVGMTLILGMGNYPLYVFSSALIVMLAASCLAVFKFDRRWKNIAGIVCFFAVEIVLLIYFKKYCEEL